MAQAFDELSAKDRQVLALLVFEQLSIKEIAVVLGTTENNTSQRLKRARERLANNLKQQLSETND